VEVKAHRRQHAARPAPVGQPRHDRDQEQTGEQTVTDHPVGREVGGLAPEHPDPVEIRQDRGQRDEPPVLARTRPQAGDDPAEADVREEVQGRQHGTPPVDGAMRRASSSSMPMTSTSSPAAR
jgi:hypothetical protein